MSEHNIKDNPICPLCKKRMAVVEFKGYYDSFVYWGCDCRDEDLVKYKEDYWLGEFA
jgi:hypothetical protein